MKIKKQILCYMLFLCFCVPLFGSASAQAGTVNNISTESELVSAFYDGGSYVLKNSITLTKELQLSNSLSSDNIFSYNDITIDLNGFTIFSDTTVLTIGAYGKNGKGNITLLDSQGGGGIITSGLLSPAIVVSNTAGDCYSCVLTIRGGTYSGSDCALSIGEGLNLNVQIASGTFSYTAKSGMPIRGAYSASSAPVYSENGKTLTISASSPDPASTTQAASEPSSVTDTTEPTVPEQNPQAQKQAAKLDVNTDIPRASYTISIPATIKVPMLERARADAPEAEKISHTPFSVSIQNIENFFNEKTVCVTLSSNYLMENTEQPEDTLIFNVLQGETAYSDGSVFAQLDEANKQAQGSIAIDKSTIRRSGNYQGKVEFIFDLKS